MTKRQIGLEEEAYHTMDFGKKKLALIGNRSFNKICSFHVIFYRLPPPLLPHPDNLPSFELGIHRQSVGSSVLPSIHGPSLPSYGGRRAEGLNRLQRKSGHLPQEGIQWSLYPGSWVYFHYYRFI